MAVYNICYKEDETIGTCQIVPKWYQKGQTSRYLPRGTSGYIKKWIDFAYLNLNIEILKEKDV